MQRIVSTQDDNYDTSQLFTVCPYQDGSGYYNLDLSNIKNKKEFIIRSLIVLAGTENKEMYEAYRKDGIPTNPVDGIKAVTASSSPNAPQIKGGGEIEQFVLGGQEQEFFTTTKRDQRVFENRIVGCLMTAFFHSHCLEETTYANNVAYKMPYNFEKNQAELKYIGMDATVSDTLALDPNSGEEKIKNTFNQRMVGSGLDYKRMYDHYFNLALSFYKTVGDEHMVKILKIIDEARREKKIRDIKDTFSGKKVSFETLEKGDMSFRLAKIEDAQHPDSAQRRLVDMKIMGIGQIPMDRIKNFNDNVIEFTNEHGNSVFDFFKSNFLLEKSSEGYVLSSGIDTLKDGGERKYIDSQDCVSWKDGSYICTSGEHTGQYCLIKEAPDFNLKPEDLYVKNLKYGRIGAIDEDGNLIEVEGFLHDKASCFNFGKKGPFVKFFKMKVNGKEIDLKEDKENFLKHYNRFLSALANGISVKKDSELGEMLDNFGSLKVDERFVLAKLAVLNKQVSSEKKDEFIEDKKKKEKEALKKEKQIKQLEERKKKAMQDLASGKLQAQIDATNEATKRKKVNALFNDCNSAIEEINRNIGPAPVLKSIDNIEISMLDKILDVFRSAFGFKTKRRKMEEKILSENAFIKQKWDSYVKTFLTRKASASQLIQQALDSGEIALPSLQQVNDNLAKYNLAPIQATVSQTGDKQLTNLNSGRRRGRARQ